MVNDRSLAVSPLRPGYVQPLSLNGQQNTDCGFIQTNIMVLRDIFSESELPTVLGFCERKNDGIFRHCYVSRDTKLKNNIPTDIDGKLFNCLHL